MGSGALEQLIEVLQQIAQRLEGIEQELRQLRIIGAGNGFHSLPDIPPHAFTGEEQPFSTAEEEKLSSPEEALRSWLEQRKLELQHAIYLELQEEPWDWFARFFRRTFYASASFLRAVEEGFEFTAGICAAFRCSTTATN